MAYRRKNFDAYVKVLVETLSGFKECDENQEICMNYAISNLNYHRFLDPDSHKIKRAINGLAEKFRVHSQLEKATSLQKLVAEFMSTVEDDSPTETDCYYAMLSVLLLLSDHPIQNEYVEQHRRAPSPEEEIDWATILMEGEEIQRVFPESPEWSDLEEDEQDEVDVAGEPDPGAEAIAEDVDDGFHDEEQTLIADSGLSSLHSSRLPFSSGHKGAAWLNENVVEPYWSHALNSGEFSDKSRSTKLAQQWADYSFSHHVLGPLPSELVMEQHLVRETLWMLGGVDKLHLFTLNDDKFGPRENISVSHLTQEALKSFLDDACHFGTIVRRFQRFCAEMTEPTQSSDVIAGSDDVIACRTYLAFATSLHSFLAEMKAQLCELEKTCTQKGLLLSALYQSLKPRFAQLSLLEELFTNSVDQRGHVDNAERAENLLRTMLKMLNILDCYGELRADGLALLLPMYLETIRPYLQMMDQLITVGRIDDHTNEFLVRRDPKIKVRDENFWSDAYALGSVAKRSEQVEKGQTNNMAAEHKHGDTESSLPSRHVASLSANEKRPAYVPVFAAVLEDLILAGKSMEILHDLGRLSDVYDAEYQSLHSSILAELITSDDQSERTLKAVDTTLETRKEEDKLLLANFQRLINLTQSQGEEWNEKRRMKNSNLGSWPLQRRVDDILVRRVSARCQHVSATLFRVLVDEYDVMTHLNNVRKYFLMEAGDVMYDFYTDLFEKLRNQEEWCDVSYLTVLLQDCLFQHQQQCKLFAHVDQSQVVRRQPINALDCLSLVYDVIWPVSIVIGRRCQAVYNSIFTWVLQIKRAKYSLDELHYREFCARRRTDQVTSPKDGVLYHRVQLFRMKLMNFVNALHNYIMTGVLHSNGHLFTASLETTTDVAQLLDLHTSFLSQIHAECLLTKNVILLKEAASKVLNMCLVFQAKMENEGLTRLNISDLADMETELSRCLQFVSSFLHKLTKHSSVPHLECLAVCVAETLNT